MNFISVHTVSGKVSRNGANINTTNGSVDGSSLIEAAKNGNLNVKKQNHCSIFVKKIFRVGQEQVVSLLIQNGANVDQMQDGETALHAIATTGIDSGMYQSADESHSNARKSNCENLGKIKFRLFFCVQDRKKLPVY